MTDIKMGDAVRLTEEGTTNDAVRQAFEDNGGTLEVTAIHEEGRGYSVWSDKYLRSWLAWPHEVEYAGSGRTERKAIRALEDQGHVVITRSELEAARTGAELVTSPREPARVRFDKGNHSLSYLSLGRLGAARGIVGAKMLEDHEADVEARVQEVHSELVAHGMDVCLVDLPKAASAIVRAEFHTA